MSYTSTDNGLTWLPPVSLTPPRTLPTNFPGNPNFSVSCDLSGSCAAVSFYNTNEIPISYTSNDNGLNWVTSITLPPQISGSGRPESISCNNTGRCVAVGSYFNGSQRIPVSYFSNDKGVNWALSTILPAPQDTGVNNLYGVSCDNSTHCVAVGAYADGSNENFPLTYYSNDNGVTWSSPILPPPQGVTSNILRSVSCNNSGNCVAVGRYNGNTPLNYISNNYGATWTFSPLISSITTMTAYHSVVCTDDGHCTVVGSYINGGQSIPFGYFSSNNGQDWTLSTSFPIYGSGNHALSSVRCEPAGHCIAVGSYNDTTPLSYISEDYGLNWRLSDALPAPIGDINVLTGVSGNGF